ncbi:TMEM175 [Branchiostoma lanceolatum]|uniref:Endosomal/lysosomal proton channel TMEM175 n=1 Tax=Branchiostoma lanceolatum TaxID=7740 RepID=A0A8J9Z3H2_BRALA|nr:TMEM175 [Branchiostoma lanceolatum]
MARDQHISSAERLLSYSDAVFSIITTIMIVPLGGETVEEIKSTEDLLEGVKSIWFKILVYATTFVIVASTWSTHTSLFGYIEKVNESIILLNLGVLMASTFLPFSFLMFAEHPTEPLAVVLFCASIVIAGTLMAGIAWQAYSRPNLLNEDEARYGEIKSKRCRTMLMMLGKPVLALVAAGIGWIRIEAAWALLVMVLLEPLLRQVIISLYYFGKGDGDAGCKVLLPSRLLVETTGTLRTRVYSDGVYAIIATLIILDICVENVPSQEDDIAKHGDLITALKHDQHVFMSYAGTFITICMLWYLHHSIFYRIFAENPLLAFFNKLALMFAGLLPIVFKITGEFGKEVSAGDAAIAVQLNAGTVLFSSIWHLVMWIIVMKNKSKLLHRRFDDVDEDKYMNTFMIIRLCVYPTISLLLFLLCFVPTWKFDSEVINWVQISTPGVFIIIKIVRNCVQRREDKKRPSEKEEEDPEMSYLPANKYNSKANNRDHENDITAV